MGKRITAVLALLTVATVVPVGPASAGEGHTYLSYSVPDDGGLATGTLQPSDGAVFTVANPAPRTPALRVEDGHGGSWLLQIENADAGPLTTGLQETKAVADGDHAGLRFLVPVGDGCPNGDGWIDVHEVAFDEDGVLTRLAADFEMHCHGGQAGRGTVRFNSTMGPSPQQPGTLTVQLEEGPYPIEDFYVAIWSDDWRFPIHPAESHPRGGQASVSMMPGTYYVYGGNYEPSTNTLFDYFGEWYDNVPELLLWDATPIVVRPGEATSVTIALDPLFDDMLDSTFEQDIAWMQMTGITKGCDALHYCPDDPVTRGQMAAFLARAFQLPPAGSGAGFSDTGGSTFAADIERLAAAGITKGCSGDRFCPDDLVTRGQMAAFLVRAMGYADRGSVDFADDDGSVFEADIERLAAAGVTTGCGAGRFCPEEYVTRGQMAAFLHRALGDGVLYLGSAGERTAAPPEVASSGR
jgi:hypothetical protein